MYSTQNCQIASFNLNYSFKIYCIVILKSCYTMSDFNRRRGFWNFPMKTSEKNDNMDVKNTKNCLRFFLLLWMVPKLNRDNKYVVDWSDHGLRTTRDEIAFTARPKIHSHSQIFRYGRSIFCLPHRPNSSDIFDFCHGLRTPNEGTNLRYLKKWADVADKICCRHT